MSYIERGFTGHTSREGLQVIHRDSLQVILIEGLQVIHQERVTGHS